MNKHKLLFMGLLILGSCGEVARPVPPPPVTDADADGFVVNVDCNDSDPLINPSATEVPNNSVDENCDPIDDIATTGLISADDDGDGLTEEQNDCNDSNADIAPNKTDIPGNGIDENCDGVDGLSAAKTTYHHVFILTEQSFTEEQETGPGTFAVTDIVHSNITDYVIDHSGNLVKTYELYEQKESDVSFCHYDGADGVYALISENDDYDKLYKFDVSGTAKPAMTFKTMPDSESIARCGVSKDGEYFYAERDGNSGDDDFFVQEIRPDVTDRNYSYSGYHFLGDFDQLNDTTFLVTDAGAYLSVEKLIYDADEGLMFETEDFDETVIESCKLGTTFTAGDLLITPNAGFALYQYGHELSSIKLNPTSILERVSDPDEDDCLISDAYALTEDDYVDGVSFIGNGSELLLEAQIDGQNTYQVLGFDVATGNFSLKRKLSGKDLLNEDLYLQDDGMGIITGSDSKKIYIVRIDPNPSEFKQIYSLDPKYDFNAEDGYLDDRILTVQE